VVLEASRVVRAYPAPGSSAGASPANSVQKRIHSRDSRSTAGILLLTILAVEFGGLTVLRMVRGHRSATEFQKTFARAGHARAGHAHAGVLMMFALVAQILAEAARLDGAVDFPTRNGIWIAAILLPAGFFLSSAGQASSLRIDSRCCSMRAPARSALASLRSESCC
jgi:hypothetical protein